MLKPNLAKICSGCGTEQPLTNFHKDKNTKSGVRSRCKSCISTFMRQKYPKDAERIKSYGKKWRAENREYVLERDRKNKIGYYHANKEAHQRRNRLGWPKARAKRLQRVPPWLTAQQKQQIAYFYEHAKDCESVSGDVYHVDHIVPLVGREVCGLHVPWNLQVLPADVNHRKGNRYNAEQS